ncbi:MAG: 5'/3'-nucleotidase SurE [Proteobacteria bacterium]|nr:5'/3'-nucleotidase SurE [Pseudomonadota bacterium]
MHILVTNDDGILAPGLAALVRRMEETHRVSVVAPEFEQTAVGHAITLADPIRVRRVHRNGRFYGWAVSGTPADCVKIGLLELLDSPPDLVLSGINPGPNVGVNVLYSGTVSAATEAAILGLPGVAFSLDAYIDPDFTPAARLAARLVDALAPRLSGDWPEGICLNVNFPALPLAEIKGLSLTRQAVTRLHERFEKRLDPHGRAYYWQCGQEPKHRVEPGTDVWALARGLVSVSPLRPDLSAPQGADWARDLDISLEIIP